MAACQSGAFEAYRAEQRRALSAAARWLECVRGTDKALGESQLSRLLTRATATPSTRMCALHVCRHPCTSALARMLTRRCCASLGRLWDHFFDYGVSLSYPFTNSDKLDYGRRALFFTCDLGSWTPSTAGGVGKVVEKEKQKSEGQKYRGEHAVTQSNSKTKSEETQLARRTCLRPPSRGVAAENGFVFQPGCIPTEKPGRWQ